MEFATIFVIKFLSGMSLPQKKLGKVVFTSPQTLWVLGLQKLLFPFIFRGNVSLTSLNIFVKSFPHNGWRRTTSYRTINTDSFSPRNFEDFHIQIHFWWICKSKTSSLVWYWGMIYFWNLENKIFCTVHIWMKSLLLEIVVLYLLLNFQSIL